MQGKRHRPHDDAGGGGDGQIRATSRPAKRPRLATSSRPASSSTCQSRAGIDLISPLSDELLIRILSFLPLANLVAVAPVSRRFSRLAADSQLWKALYYGRFVLPRAMRIPGFRDAFASSAPASQTRHKLHYSGRRKLWADGRKGGVVMDAASFTGSWNYDWAPCQDRERLRPKEGEAVDWKRQYKIRHNWARGNCAVEELDLGADARTGSGSRSRKMLVKVVEGIAITADSSSGLRCWDLKTRDLLVKSAFQHGDGAAIPTCIAIDDQDIGSNSISIAVGFLDGGFGIWQLHIGDDWKLLLRFRHEKSSNGELIGIAYSHPYLLTATESVLVSLYTFDGRNKDTLSLIRSSTGTEPAEGLLSSDNGHRRGNHSSSHSTASEAKAQPGAALLGAPLLLKSLRSHVSQPPLALSIRRLSSVAVASIAYTFFTRQGWSIGIQALHIKAPIAESDATPPEIATVLAYTTPESSGRRPPERLDSPTRFSSSQRPLSPPPPPLPEPGPTTLCYSHPYLLAALPDNTLVLHLCTSNSSTLSLSPGIRLWGHTSGISDAEITARGKAVSVSYRGEEMRVWELEGRPSIFSGQSVEIRPNTSEEIGLSQGRPDHGWDERRNWVGFDDEMVIVLKESGEGTECLMVYDFT